MNVTIRTRARSKGRSSLYLDITDQNRRKRITLGFKVYDTPKDTLQRIHNKDAWMKAKQAKASWELKGSLVPDAFEVRFDPERNFLQYFEKLTEDRYNSKKNYDNWDSVLKILRKFTPMDTTFDQVDTIFVHRFKDFLDMEYRTKAGKPLSQNSKFSYFNKLKASLKQAVRDQVIPNDPSAPVKGFQMEDGSNREFLTLEEVKSLANTPCESEMLGRAFLFSCLTGVRWSDVIKMEWRDIQESKELGHFIRFTQRKTGQHETLPLSDQAMEIMPEPDPYSKRVFPGLVYSSSNNMRLKRWALKAGIAKNVTFHVARHTFATLQLSMGTEIYTVSKLLGHKNLKTTQVYARVIDSKKKEAVDRIPDIF